MGTATLTRSQSRKARSTCTLEAIERGSSSPFVVLPGNHLESSSRRPPRRPPNTSKFVEKENAPPSLSTVRDGKSHPGSEKKVPADASQHRALNKRKHSACRAASPSKVVDENFEAPVTLELENAKTSHDVQVVVNPSRSETCVEINLCSDDRHQEDRLEPSGSIAARKASAGYTEEDRTEAPRKQEGNVQNAGVSFASSSALALLQKDYERLFMKYQKLKARRLDEVDELYNEQNSRITDFVKATEALLNFYKQDNVSLRQQIQDANIPELLDRCKCQEKANIECRNELLQVQSKSLELRHENKRLKSLLLEHIADKQKHVESEAIPVQGSQNGFSTDMNNRERDVSLLNGRSKLVKRLLECVMGLQLSFGDGGDDIHFRHCPTGFSFKLKEVHDVEMAELVGGGELMYQNVSIGACKRAVDWMKEKEVIFGMDQAQLLFKRLVGFLNRGFYG